MKKLLSVLLAALTCLFLVACAPADLDKAEEKLEKAGYDNITVIEGQFAEALKENSVGQITVIDKKGMMVAVLFEDAASAKDYYEDLKEEDDDKDDDDVVKKSGKWVVAGNEDIVKDFLKLF